MASREPIRIEGFDADELVGHPVEELVSYIEAGAPVVAAVGSAKVLCEFSGDGDTLVAVLAHIDGGGEGILRAIHRIVQSAAAEIGYTHVKWIVTAVSCANPNPKLRHTLERLNFRIEDTRNFGSAYVLTQPARPK